MSPTEIKEYASRAKPEIGIGKIAGIALGVTAVGAVVGFVPGQLTATEPDRADYTYTEEVQRNAFELTIHNPHGVLSADDERILQRDAERIEAPEVVQSLNYIVFAENDENVNDTVENYLRDNHPELIGDDSFADGVLIIGVGLEPRQSFVFAGDDVADTLLLHSGSHLDNAITAIQPGVRDGNIPGGLFAGADAATDIEAVSQSLYDDAQRSYETQRFVPAAVGGALGLTAGVGVPLLINSRRRKAQQARIDYATISTEYTKLSQRLDAIDIRAHSVSSELLDETLRAQWKEIRDHFLGLHEIMVSPAISALSPKAEDKEFLAEAGTLAEAAATTRNVGYAEKNINTLFDLDNGDTRVRREETRVLRDDAVAARLEIEDTSHPVNQQLTLVIEGLDELISDPERTDFVERFSFLLRDYQASLSQLKKEKFSDVEEHEELRKPKLYDKDYHAGYGVGDFVPYYVLATWHSDNVAAAESASSSTNSSFSSGFSGAGGSSSF